MAARNPVAESERRPQSPSFAQFLPPPNRDSGQHPSRADPGLHHTTDSEGWRSIATVTLGRDWGQEGRVPRRLLSRARGGGGAGDPLGSRDAGCMHVDLHETRYIYQTLHLRGGCQVGQACVLMCDAYSRWSTSPEALIWPSHFLVSMGMARLDFRKEE
ncbi:hypothetical protein BO71DRAFT_143707 [Aspergillus ellipticus CBS 707.79]|uniref:Uncharacterized protein n=1 Tax=Aspergillus ellipticus CBS 707.79 TaxID=1448320 RepID=A0A319CU63_9EURO|nr:hypothetical protein BO71DRAFT_143707 [Aspergillus ellipticus CBS 707.79]